MKKKNGLYTKAYNFVHFRGNFFFAGLKFCDYLAITKIKSGEIITNKVRIIPRRTNPTRTSVLF